MGEVSSRIFRLMSEKNLSYGRMSEITGIPKSGIYRYAHEPNDKIPLPKIKLIADALNVSAAYLMGWDNNLSENTTKVANELDPVTQELFDLVDGMSFDDLLMVIDMIKAVKRRRGETGE